MHARRGLLASLAALAAPLAHAGVVTLNFWDARVNYGVLADGGAMTSPIQGPEELVTGIHALEWTRTDGAAQARAGAQYALALTHSPSLLSFSLDVKTDAWAQVGPCPQYPFARGQAEAWFDYAIFDFTLHQPALLTVTGAPLGGYQPGTHTLQPGDHVLEIQGPGGMSWVSVGPTATAQSQADFAAAFTITAVPAPAGALAMAGVGIIATRRRR